MRKPVVVGILILMALLQVNGNLPQQENPASKIIRNWIIDELKNSQQHLSLSLQPLNSVDQLRSHYHEARKHYKHVEFFVEYHSPREARNYINGPLVPKIDMEVNSEALPPQGFQRIEELLFSASEVPDTSVLHQEYRLLLKQLSEITNYYQHIKMADGQLLEMSQLELFRVSAMNLSGYDATISLTNVKESLWCMEGIENVLLAFKTYANQGDAIKRSYNRLLKEVSNTKKYLRNYPDYNSFNRLDFITGCINPLNKSIVQFHDLSKLEWNKRNHAIKLNQGFLFGGENFNVQYFSIYYHDTVNIQQQAQLGKLLFFDPALSGNNKRACASCHHPAKAFTDGYARNKEFEGTDLLLRNTPTLINVIYQKAFFYDGRVYELERQIMDVVHNKLEMQGSLDEVVTKLRTSSEYKRLFRNAFEGSPDSVITPYAIQKAITEYEKTLLSWNSRFDQYLHGNKRALNASEINGYNLFAGKALCGSCHFFPLFNGTVPPIYRDSEYEVIGTPEDASNKKLDADPGRYSVTDFDEHLFAFKTPTVRNIEFTAPYMHNGIYPTLEEVIEFYHQGGGAGLKYEVPNQTLPFDSLVLTPKEKADIVLFLKSLSDTVGLSGKPSHLPAFENNPMMNKRIIGGEY
jgi:cytochrome c peroxidase